MKQRGEMTDEKRLAILNEYLSSGKSRWRFAKENGIPQTTFSNWVRIFAVDKVTASSPHEPAIDMNKDQEKEELLIEISRLRQELRQKSLDLKYTEMARDAYEQMILLAEKRYGLPIRKKCDAK